MLNKYELLRGCGEYKTWELPVSGQWGTSGAQSGRWWSSREAWGTREGVLWFDLPLAGECVGLGEVRWKQSRGGDTGELGWCRGSGREGKEEEGKDLVLIWTWQEEEGASPRMPPPGPSRGGGRAGKGDLEQGAL